MRWIFCGLMLWAGCAARRPPDSYRLVRREGGVVLMPPGVSNPALERRTIRAEGRRITVDRRELLAHPPGWIAEWSEQQGWGFDAAARIAEALPLEPNLPYRLLHGAHIGSVDLGPESRLQVVTPILRAGASPNSELLETAGVSGGDRHLSVDLKASAALIGYETAWYAARRRASGGLEFVAVGSASAAGNYLQFPETARFYRLVYKSSEENQVASAVLVSAATRSELEEKTRAGTGVQIPKRVALNAYVAVTANGTEIAAPNGATVRGVLVQAGEKDPAGAIGRLRVWKPYGGRLREILRERGDAEILRLAVHGGEVITW